MVNWKRYKFSLFAFTLEIVFIILFGVLAEYDEPAKPTNKNLTSPVPNRYPMFQDVHVMIFVGFGFLMTFLKRYGYSAVGVNLLIAAFAIQWAFLVRGVIHEVTHGEKIHITLLEMLSADFASATVLISFGAVLGKTSALQLLVMALIEVVLAQINEYIGLDKIGGVDVGESMYIHAFGAYFGLAVARVLYTEDIEDSKGEGTVYHSDLFSMIGTIFLWLFWPSFNGGAADDDEQYRAVINTYLSLCACTVVTFALSAVVDKKGRVEMVHIQNATLAGGVAVGTSANMPLHPWGALLAGSVAGVISVLGYKFLTPMMAKKLRIHDTCGVHNLHGMPGVLAGIVGAVAAAMASEATWGQSYYEIFGKVIPMDNTTELADVMSSYSFIEKGGDGRSALQQGGFQMLALLVTLCIAILGGILTGFLLKLPIFNAPKKGHLFDDQDFWVVQQDGFPQIEVDDMNETHNETKMVLIEH
ncbi:hypothetical protein CHS0354_018229 [Potamilus streckersoni]|uniref:Ammonium transporter AmtB-like domain-containing protein n=1 Tax=Potamilus streckersoni TaxID=2493646 RepID=A0AAE0SXZ2_9BIVA|nr:hypothetical protein CHS0354_018229 [Potamilus streckersoni]